MRRSDPPRNRRLSTEPRYYREHVLPWIARRLRGRSSGDGRTGKDVGRVPVNRAQEAGSDSRA